MDSSHTDTWRDLAVIFTNPFCTSAMKNNEQLFALHSCKTKSHNKQVLKDFQ